jgi:hypothetical protein
VAYVKRRTRPEEGSIPALLGMFDRELRFYREIAPEIGVRTPALYDWGRDVDEIRIELEDLSGWDEGGDPVAIASVLEELHRRWSGSADDRWPWLNRAGAAADEIGRLYDRVWTGLRSREDVTPPVRVLGDALHGRVAALERDESARGPRTLIHGDAAVRNTRTSPTAELVLLDWEDVRTAQGEVDLTWLLVSSVEPARWDEVIDAYGPDGSALRTCLPANAAQAMFGLADEEPGSDAALAWIARLEAVAALLHRT